MRVNLRAHHEQADAKANFEIGELDPSTLIGNGEDERLNVFIVVFVGILVAQSLLLLYVAD